MSPLPVNPSSLVQQIVLPKPTPETMGGIKNLLSAVGSAKDPELLEMVSEIWGEGYHYQIENPLQIRAEVVGFLLDQRDLLQMLGMEQTVEPMPEQMLPQSSSSQNSSKDVGNPTVPLDDPNLRD